MSDLGRVTPGQERLGRATPGKERLFELPSNKRNLTPSERARGNPGAVAPSQLDLRNILKSLESESVRERRFRFSTVVSNTRWVGKTGGSLKASRLVEARSEAVRRR